MLICCCTLLLLLLFGLNAVFKKEKKHVKIQQMEEIYKDFQ